MRIIPKFANGGDVGQFFTTFTPIQTQRQTPSQGSTSTSKQTSNDDDDDDDKGKLTEKDLFTMLKEVDGLPNEVNALLNELSNVFTIKKLTGIDTTSLATQYLSALSKLNTIRHNSESFKKAYDKASTNNTLNEIAISSSGKVFAQDLTNGKILEITPQDYHKIKDSGKYQLLTNDNIAYIRANDPRLINNQDYISIIDNAINGTIFDKLVKDATRELGTSEFSRKGLFNVNGQAAKGLEVLQNLSEEDKKRVLSSITTKGDYNYDILNKSQTEQLKALTAYITTVLPNRAKTWASLQISNSTPNEAAKKLVTYYLLAGIDETDSMDISKVGKNGKSGSGSGNSDDSDIDEYKLNAPSKFLAGYGDKNIFTINLGSNRETIVASNSLPISTTDGKYLPVNSSLQDLTNSEFSGILDFTNVSIGMNLIQSQLFKQVILNDNKIYSIDFPCKILPNGTIIPDLSIETINKKDKADKQLRNQGIDINDKNSIIQNYQIINTVYKNNGLQEPYNSDGSIKSNTWRRFAVFNGYSSSQALGEDYNESIIQELDGSIEDDVANIIKENDKNYSNGFGDSIYKGTIWIPVKVDYISASSNKELNSEILREIEIRQAALQASQENTREKL